MTDQKDDLLAERVIGMAHPRGLSWDRFRITMRHDAGLVAVTVPAQSIASAVATVLEVEGAPERAIVKIERVKGPHR